MSIEVHGVVVKGQHMAAMWMNRDHRLFADALGVIVKPGTINIRFEADAHERLHRQLLIGGECVDPGFIRSTRHMVVRNCEVNGVQAFIVRHQLHPDRSSIVEVIAPLVPGLRPDMLATLVFEPDTSPRSILVASR